MQRKLNDTKDLLAGAIFIAFGGTTFLIARGYTLGTALDMGPGYFPVAVGLLLAGLGVLAIARGLTATVPNPIMPHRVQPLILIFASIVAFALLIERAGLVIAAAALIGIVCLPRLRTRPLEVLAIYLVLVGFCAVVFVWWLEMQLPLFWW